MIGNIEIGFGGSSDEQVGDENNEMENNVEMKHSRESYQVMSEKYKEYKRLLSEGVSREEIEKYGYFEFGLAIELEKCEDIAKKMTEDMGRKVEEERQSSNDPEEIAAIEQYYQGQRDGLFEGATNKYMSENREEEVSRAKKCIEKSIVALNDIEKQDTHVLPTEISYENAWPIIKENNELVKKDWVDKITDLDEYEPSKPFRLICGCINLAHAADDHLLPFASASLITESHKKFYKDNTKMGFVYDPNDIVASDSQDMNSETYTAEERFVMGRVGELPVVKSIGRVEKEMKENDEMSEVVVKARPIGIFYRGEPDKALKDFIKMNPGLKVIQLPS